MTEWTPRTADEIVERYRRSGNPFGWERETVVRYLSWDEAKGIVADSAEGWATFSRPRTVEAIRADALAYIDYTIGRVIAHRNNEAQRSMHKLGYWCWLLGGDRLANAPDSNDERGPYCMVPIRRSIEFIGGEWPPVAYRDHINSGRIPLTDLQRSQLERMAEGKPCKLRCTGCLPDAEPDGATSWTT